MEKVLQSATDIERKLGKINTITAKGAAKMNINDMVKQLRKGNAIKATIKKGIKSCDNADPAESQMKELIAILTRIVVLEEIQMGFAIESKPHFDKLHCSGMVKKSVEKSEMTPSIIELGRILAEKHFPGMKPELDELKTRELETVKKMLAVYSNAIGGEDQADDDSDDSD